MQISKCVPRINPFSSQNPRGPLISRDTLRKVFVVACCALLIFGVFIPPVAGSPIANRCEDGICEQSQTPEYLEPYVSPLDGRVTPDDPGVIERFPDWLSRFPHNELLVTESGKNWCLIEDKKVPNFEDCDRLAPINVEFVKEVTPPEIYKSMVDDNFDVSFRERGYGLRAMIDEGTGISQVGVNFNPQKFTNQKAALEYLEQTVLQDPHFFEHFEEEIIAVIKHTHAILMNLLPDREGTLRPGKYRDQAIFVTDEKKEISFNEFKRILMKKGGTKKDALILKNIFAKWERYGFFEDTYKHFSRREKAVFKKVAYVAPMPDQIEKEMRIFAKRLKEVGAKVRSRELPAVSVASWVHAELGRIHPFADGNGREARAWTDVMLQLGGYRGIIFPDDDAYTQAIEANQKQPGRFSSFLEETIAWAREQEALS